jgi:anti-anti-sigma factor
MLEEWIAMASTLQIKQSRQAARVPVTVIELAGEMDASNYEQFQKEALQSIEAGALYVLLDFSQLSYISSAGLRALYILANALSAKGEIASGTINLNTGSFKSPYFKLFNPSPNVRQALDMMGFTMSMEIYSDFNQALASF